MELLLVLVFAVLIGLLWKRFNALTRRIEELEARLDQIFVAAPPMGLPLDPPPSADEVAKLAASPSDPLPAASAEVCPEPSEPLDLSRISLPERLAALRPRFDFEEVFGRLLPIWAGGIALSIAGFFLVRWSIEVGMLSERVRVGLGLAFGLALLAGAELAFRFEDRVRDVRVRQALAGAGLATLYASFYLAGSFYGLIGPGLAFAGLAGVTALAILLSFRFGLPSAVLGLVGGFAAPALAGSADPNLPLLATYLALVTGGLAVTGERQRRPWLGLAALAGGLGWGVLMLLAGPVEAAGVLAVGGYLVLLGTLLPTLLGTGPLGQVGRIVAAGLATLQIAALVDRSGYSLLAWGCYLLLAAALAILGTRWRRLREASAIAAALAACLLAVWPTPPAGWFALFAAAFALVFAVPPLWCVLRASARTVDHAQLALFPLALIAAICIQFDLALLEDRDTLVALAALLLAAAPVLAAWKTWPAADEDFAFGPAAAVGSAFVLVLLAGLLALPAWSAPLVTAALAAPAFMLRRSRDRQTTGWVQAGIAMVGVVLLLNSSDWQELASFVEGSSGGPQWRYALRWLAAAIPFALLGQFGNRPGIRRMADGGAALLAYGMLAMLLPDRVLPLAAAGGAVLVAWTLDRRGAGIATLLGIGALWASFAVAEWLAGGIAALGGSPMLFGDLPGLALTLRTVAPLAAALGGVALLRKSDPARRRNILPAGALMLVMIVAHVGYKHLFAIDDEARFVARGLAERTLWQGALALVAVALATLPGSGASRVRLGRAIGLLAVVHFVWFSLLAHNPLWTAQAVGSWPIVNLLLASYGIAIGLVLWLRKGQAGAPRWAAGLTDAAVMALIALLALSELRQMFAGSLLLEPPAGQREDLLRSILAICVALGFLGWGTWRGRRNWRVGSLVLMLLAVFKVFIFDAAALEGLARIASFFALGGCLIAIGWFYSRQLSSKPREDAAPG